jgi:ribosomal-protein-alanine N-acetyltransferase
MNLQRGSVSAKSVRVLVGRKVWLVGVGVRVITDEDAEPITALLQSNREFLTPWEPTRTDDFFTVPHQLANLIQSLARYREGTAVPLVIVDGERLVGRITITDIVRGPFQSAHLGYWVDQSVNGRGVATAAVGAVLQLAFGQLGLHRLQAGTLMHNAASQRVLAHNGFTRIGIAPNYLRIAGTWQDHILYQRLDERQNSQDSVE